MGLKPKLAAAYKNRLLKQTAIKPSKVQIDADIAVHFSERITGIMMS
jgi:hypothetical protein